MIVNYNMKLAPKDHKILVYHRHNPDYFLNDGNNLTSYGAWCECSCGGSYIPEGWFIAEWGGGYYEEHHEYGVESMPDWWMDANNDGDWIALYPIAWCELPILENI